MKKVLFSLLSSLLLVASLLSYAPNRAENVMIPWAGFQPPGFTTTSSQPCVPLSGVVNIPAMNTQPNTLLNPTANGSGGCTGGGLSIVFTTFTATTFTYTISPPLPNDGSGLIASPVVITPDGTYSYGPAWCWIGTDPGGHTYASQSTCTESLPSVNFPVGSYAGVMFQYYAGSSAPRVLNLPTVTWTIQ